MESSGVTCPSLQPVSTLETDRTLGHLVDLVDTVDTGRPVRTEPIAVGVPVLKSALAGTRDPLR